MGIQLKWFDGITDAQRRPTPGGPLPPFERSTFVAPRWKQTLQRFAFRVLVPAMLAVLRALWPNPRWGRLVVVTRAADVREVLRNAETFIVPFGPEMVDAAGHNAVLGLNGADHARIRPIIEDVVDRQGDLERLTEWSERYARALIAAAPGRIDVIGDLITRTATESCGRFLGLTIDDPDGFAAWTTAVSALIFADPGGDSATRTLALNGGARLRAVVDDAIARVHANDAQQGKSKRERVTLVDRLIGSGLSDDEVRANLMALATGLVPTTTIAAGNILEQLLKRPSLWHRACTAAKENDNAALREVLLTAARRNPALVPGQWRYAATDGVIAAGTWRERRVAAGSVVLVATQSALRDGRERPTDAWDAAALMFGTGAHECVGRHIAMAQIERVFLVLLAQEKLRLAPRHGWIQRMGVFPVRCDMTFLSPTTPQSMIIIAAPVCDDADRGAIEQRIAALGNPAGEALRDALDATGLVHFASLSVIATAKAAPSSILLLELNVDGPEDVAIAAVAEHGFALLGPVFQHASATALDDHKALAELLQRFSRDLHCWPWGPIGIHFNGTDAFSVAQIERQRKLADFAREQLEPYFQRNIGDQNRAIDALRRVRRLIKQDSFLTLRQEHRRSSERIAELQYDIVRPSRSPLTLADWRPPTSKLAPLWTLLRSDDGLIVIGLAIILWLLGFGLLRSGVPPHDGQVAGAIWAGASAALGATAALIATIALLATAFAIALRWNESRDVPDEGAASAAHVAAVGEREDSPYCEQNHIIAVMPLKRGAARKLIFAFALWGIKQSIRYWFRPGFVVTIGSIHYAKWFRVPNTEQFVFLSNYDGSWESYLEDFITRAHWGQTAAWSNGEGFPRTKWLVMEGAADGDRFKRWVRKQQQPTLCWYSRYPDLTAKAIRNNALIAEGLARGASDTDARRWLACFGSAQREQDQLETDEVQSIAFGGFGSMNHAACLTVQLPSDPKQQREWLGRISGERPARQVGPAVGQMPLFDDDLSPFLSASGHLKVADQLTFGDHPVERGAAVLGLSARGLEKLGLPSIDEPDGVGAFPTAFAFGMASRGKILGDVGATSAGSWGWSDGRDRGVDAVILVYGATAADRDARAALQRSLLRRAGGDVLDIIPTDPLRWQGEPANLHREHFGFRDGFSQPVIRGTERAASNVPERDLVAPGEFIFGYRNNQGYLPPVIGVRAESDRRRELAIVVDPDIGKFPKFGDAQALQAWRDFGRNGSFLVVRQLDQDVEGFQAAIEHVASELGKNYRHLERVIGQRPGPEWVAAKMIGRWRDGSPLVGNPHKPAGLSMADRPENNFAYGVDDSQGLQCPLGAHIRRANPRDSLEPASMEEQQITNRHRLLRRGRSYHYKRPDADSAGRGMLFMALCADIERQFEFVQRTWLRSSTFHGLAAEGDPLIGSGAPCRHTIPTSAGPVSTPPMSSYVTMTGGGYFFLPSRSAIKYLMTLQEGRAGIRATTDDLKAVWTGTPIHLPELMSDAAGG